MLEDKRREERIDLELPVTLANGEGISRNISGSAIYFVTDQKLLTGGGIDFSINLNYICPGMQLHLECRGQVLRIEPTGEKFGIVASLNECWCKH